MGSDRGRLVLEERRDNYLFRRYFYLCTGVFLTSLIWAAVPFTFAEGLSFYSLGGNVVSLIVFLSVSSLTIYLSLLGLRRTRLRVYENGVVPYFQPLNRFLKGHDLFVPWEKVRAIVYFGKDFFSPHDFFRFEVYLPGKLGVILSPTVFKEEPDLLLEKIESLNLKERTELLDWRDRGKIQLARRTGWLG